MAKLLLSTSYDPNFPPENTLTGNLKEFWVSTGLFPQELLFQLNAPSSPNNIKLTTTNVRHVAIEVCEGDRPGNFNKVGETEFGSNSGNLQRELVDITISRPVNFVKVVFISGWDEFISVHSVKFD
jgi:heat shock protein beta-11